MKKEEKDLLQELIDSPEGMLYRDVFAYGLKRKTAQKLIALDYVEEFSFKNMPNYRATRKGYLVFEPIWKRAWVFFTDDIAKILSIIAIIISSLVGLKQLGLL